MNILITGATGFIGRHLGRALAAQHIVFGLTRNPGTLTEIAGCPIIADLSDTHFVADLPANIDCVIHLAQSASYRDFPEGAEDMRLINIDATAKLLEWARNVGVKQFVYTSTANVYGKSTKALTESDPTQPNSFYGASKLAAEHLALQYHEYFQVDVLRCFTVYGPGQSGMLIQNIIERINTSKPVTLAEGVGIYLSPIYIGDVGVIINRLITTPARQKNRLMNVCGDQLTSLSEIVMIAEEIIGKPAIVRMTDEEAVYFTGSNERLRNYLSGYRFVDIRTGLERVIHQNNMLH